MNRYAAKASERMRGSLKKPRRGCVLVAMKYILHHFGAQRPNLFSIPFELFRRGWNKKRITKCLLTVQRRLDFFLGLREGFFHGLIAEVDALERLVYRGLDLAAVRTPVGHAGQIKRATLSNSRVVRVDDQIDLIWVSAVGKPGVDNLPLIFTAGQENSEGRRGARVLGRGV